MNNLSPQEEMIQLITNCISSNDFETAKKCLDTITHHLDMMSFIQNVPRYFYNL